MCTNYISQQMDSQLSLDICIKRGGLSHRKTKISFETIICKHKHTQMHTKLSMVWLKLLQFAWEGQ